MQSTRNRWIFCWDIESFQYWMHFAGFFMRLQKSMIFPGLENLHFSKGFHNYTVINFRFICNIFQPLKSNNIPHFMFSNNLQFKVNTIETGWFPLEHIRASSAHVFLRPGDSNKRTWSWQNTFLHIKIMYFMVCSHCPTSTPIQRPIKSGLLCGSVHTARWQANTDFHWLLHQFHRPLSRAVWMCH